MKDEALTQTIIGASMEVHRALGPGFLESIYKNALLHELRLQGLSPKTEVEVSVTYKDRVIGAHRLDITIDRVIVELKAVSAIADVHIAQTLSYMKAVGSEVALVINFGQESLVWKRLLRRPRLSLQKRTNV
jgi:GxxExxY protein